ncbi:MAG: hypothetical protein ACE5F1_15880 [Planctomycetota bacterium]
MAVIPKGVNKGKVLVWDWEAYGQQGPQAPPGPTTPYRQRWAIVDPKNPSAQGFQNALLTMPLSRRGDPMCSGHAWNQNGDLVVAGGNQYIPTIDPPGGWVLVGHKLTWLYQPHIGPMGTWTEKEGV